jgi:transposase
MQVPTTLAACLPGSPVSDPTSLPAAVVADTIVRTVELGVTITDAAVDGDATVVFCDLLDDGRRHCPGCGVEGIYRDTVIRRVTDVPVVGHPLWLWVRVPRYRCVAADCEREVFAHNTDRLARRGWSTTRRCARYILRRLMIDRATVAAVARELGLSWDTVNTIAMDATQHIVAADTTRLDGVRVIGVDEHRWSHTHRPGEDGFVTVIIDLTPVLEGSGRARLLDLVPGRSAAALKTWLSAQAAAFRDQVEVVAMDGFGGYKTAATEVLPEATPVMDPFHVVALAGTKLDLCRQRIQQQTCGHRGRAGDPLYRVRRTLRTRLPLLNTRQKARLEAVFADEAHLAVELCWGFYQRLIAAYNHPDRRRGKIMMTTIIDALRSGVPDALEELAQLGRTLWRRRADVLAYFDHHASNGPTEAINGRLEALRRNALGFRNLTHYRLRSLLHCGNLVQLIDAL